MPKVSVIVPVYNTSKYLERSVGALVNQTLQDIEILLIDDGSTDNSLEVLRDYERRFSNVKVLHKENGGQATARNLGISVATGDYIGFADSDDYVDVTMFEKMYNRAIEMDADFVECFFFFLEETKKGIRELPPRGRVREYKDSHDMLIDPQVSPWNKLYKREILLKEDVKFPEGLIYEDTAWYLKTIPYIKKSSYIDEQLVFYFLRGTSTMNANKSAKVADIFKVLEDILHFYKKYGFYEEYKKELEYFCSKIILCSNMSRIGRVTDKKLRNELFDCSFNFLRENFPEYKTNELFTGKIGFYVKHLVNRRNCWAFSSILSKVLRG